MTGTRARLVGVITDNHVLLRPDAIRELAGVELIVHAGDIGAPEVLERLRDVARVVAVRGNNRAPRAASLPDTEVVRVGPASLYVLHDVAASGRCPDRLIAASAAMQAEPAAW